MYKLIRDNIPELVEKDGKVCHFATCNTDGLFVELLRMKLVEEANEFLASNDVAKLADVLTVINTMLEVAGVSKEQFQDIYDKKLEVAGGYTKRYIGFLADNAVNTQDQQNTEGTTK